IDLSQYNIHTPHNSHGIGYQRALADGAQGADGREAGRAAFTAVGLLRAIAGDIRADFPTRGLGAHIDVALRRTHPAGHRFVGITTGHLLHHLVDEAQRFQHLPHAHHVTVPSRSYRAEFTCPDWHIKIQTVIDA